MPGAVPADYRDRLRRLRCTLKLSQSELAELVGAANKAVVYQWESWKRVPSPVFWARVSRLEVAAPASTRQPFR